MQMRFMKWLAVSNVAFALALGVAQAQDTHITFPANSGTSVTLDAFAQRIEDQAHRFQIEYPDSSIPRIILYDIAFPRDGAEFRSLNGYAVMLVSALVKDQSELPLAKIYLADNGEKAELAVFTRVRRGVPTDSIAYKKFGPFREDVFVLAPISSLISTASFAADFAAHRSGFEFGQGPVSPPAGLFAEKDVRKSNMQSTPPAESLRALIAREFPDFLEN